MAHVFTIVVVLLFCFAHFGTTTYMLSKGTVESVKRSNEPDSLSLDGRHVGPGLTDIVRACFCLWYYSCGDIHCNPGPTNWKNPGYFARCANVWEWLLKILSLGVSRWWQVVERKLSHFIMSPTCPLLQPRLFHLVHSLASSLHLANQQTSYPFSISMLEVFFQSWMSCVQ